jgi:formylglycine-generating enzyme required for sulfatase activity
MVNKTFSSCSCKWGVSFLYLFMAFNAAYSQQVPGQRDSNSSSNYALVIGIDNYRNWSPLSHAISNAAQVGNVLEKMGFGVTYRADPNSIEFGFEINKFFGNEKIDDNSSLFLWFSGYGHKVGNDGFLVPADAPNETDRGFKMKAFPVSRLEEHLRSTKAKHVFVVFDACFPGTIFREEGSESLGKTVADMKKYPVRRYLYYLSTDRKTKYDGAIGKKLIGVLRNENKADANEDNYLAFGEIIEKMKDLPGKVQLKYGKLKGYDRGDFVFSLPGQSIRYFRDTLKEGGKGPQMIDVPGGSFMMGDLQGNGFRDEKPVHLVNVSPYAVSCFEITFDEYELFCKKTNRKFPGDKISGGRPVINVSWEDAAAYAEWLTAQTGFKYRLPTEAEWEYAARANTDTDYWWGNELDRAKDRKEARAACDGCGARWGWDTEKSTAPVGSFAPNPFGIYDTVGNVWEWTCSEYTPQYNKNWKKEEICLDIKDIKKRKNILFVLRGGAWDAEPVNCRVSHRYAESFDERSTSIGFRLVRELK